MNTFKVARRRHKFVGWPNGHDDNAKGDMLGRNSTSLSIDSWEIQHAHDAWRMTGCSEVSLLLNERLTAVR